MMKWSNNDEVIKKHKDSLRKKEVYSIGEKVYYIIPERQKIYGFTINKVEITKHGTRYGGEWNGILGKEYFSPLQTVDHEDVHHSVDELVVQFIDGFDKVVLK